MEERDVVRWREAVDDGDKDTGKTEEGGSAGGQVKYLEVKYTRFIN